MTWSSDTIRSFRSHLGLNQSEFGDLLGYGKGAQQRASELERGIQQASGPLVPLLDCLAEKHEFRSAES